MANLDIECPICRDTYTRPRFLRCYHSFCTACLQQLLNSQHDRNILKCPLRCQTLTMVPSAGINALAIDHFKCNLIEQLFEASIFYTTWYREPYVAYESYDIPPRFICHIKCGFIEVLLYPFQNVQKEDETNQCESHPTQKLNYFCEKCTALICPECCLEEHQNHPTIRIEVKYLDCNGKH